MVGILGWPLLLLLAAGSADDAFRSAAAREVHGFIETELWGHYDVLSVELVDVIDRTGEWGGPYPGYGFRSVTADFLAQRNASRDERLNEEIPPRLCETEAELFLLCRPAGHELSGTLELDMVFTVDGWKILSRHHRSLQAYPLAGYLRCHPDPRDPAVDAAVIRACFGGAGHLPGW